MARTITAVQQYQSFGDYLKQRAPTQPLVQGVVKAQLAQLPSSTHVVISTEGRRRLAAAELTARVSHDWEM